MHFHTIRRHELVRFKGELAELYANRLIRAFAFSLIGVFIPIYLLNVGYSLNEVFIYLIVVYASFGAFSPVAAFVESRIGNKHTMAVSVPITIVFFFLLFLLQEFSIPVVLFSAIFGCSCAFYWIPFNSYFTKQTTRHHRGESIGVISALPHLSQIFAPALGGFIITEFNFGVLLLIAGLMLWVSLFPLFLTKDYSVKVHYKWRKVFSKQNRLFFNEFFAKGIVASSSVLWPIFIYFIREEYLFVGISSTIAGIGTAIFILFIGRLSDRVSKNTLLKIGGIANFVVWMAAAFVSTPEQVYILSFLIGFLFVLISIPMFALACNEATRQGIPEFMVFREITFDIARVSVFCTALLLPFSVSFRGVFIIAAIASLYFLIPKKTRRQRFHRISEKCK